MGNRTALISSAVLILVTLSGCASSAPSAEKLQYAQLKNRRVFDNEFPAVWKAIEATFPWNWRYCIRIHEGFPDGV